MEKHIAWIKGQFFFCFSHWLLLSYAQRHIDYTNSTALECLHQARIMLTLAHFLHFLHSVAVILRFSVYIWFGFGLVFWTPFTRLLSLICLIFIMPFSTNVMSPSPSPCAPSIATIYMPKLELVRWWLLHSWQGWSQWIVLKSVPNGNSNKEKCSDIQKVSEALKKHTRT